MSQNKSDIKINHNPVMIEQVLSGLQIKPNCNYIDCTVGEGGHTYSIINSCNPKPNILGIDLDSQALQKASKRLDSYNQKLPLLMIISVILKISLILTTLSQSMGFYLI